MEQRALVLAAEIGKVKALIVKSDGFAYRWNSVKFAVKDTPMWFWNLLGNVIAYVIAVLVSVALGALCTGVFWLVIGQSKDKFALILAVLVFLMCTFFAASDQVFPTVERLRKRFSPINKKP